MKLFQCSTHLGALGLFFALTVGLVQFIAAAQQKVGRVTQIVREVRILPSIGASHPASLNDNVTPGTAVRTGGDSRTELTFTDQTLARLGANSIFTFAESGRNFDLSGGAMLLSAPSSAQVKVGVATAAISGFTAMFERRAKSWSKFILLYGHGTISFKGVPGGPCHLHSGQMVIWPAHPVKRPDVLDVDLSKLLHGNLVAGFSHSLPEIELIRAIAEKQKTSSEPGSFVDPTNIETRDQSAAANPIPTKPQIPGGRPP